jgi:hypothetical protein
VAAKPALANRTKVGFMLAESEKMNARIQKKEAMIDKEEEVGNDKM